MEIRAVTIKWGNSIAVVIPRELVERQQIHEDEEVRITVQKQRLKAGEVFGMLKGKIKEPTQKIKDEMRRGWENASDRAQTEKWRR